MIKIIYSRTAYVLGCNDELLDSLRNEFNFWADGNENVCITWEDIISYLENNNESSKLYKFIMDIHNKIEGEIGDIIFAK